MIADQFVGISNISVCRNSIQLPVLHRSTVVVIANIFYFLSEEFRPTKCSKKRQQTSIRYLTQHHPRTPRKHHPKLYLPSTLSLGTSKAKAHNHHYGQEQPHAAPHPVVSQKRIHTHFRLPTLSVHQKLTNTPTTAMHICDAPPSIPKPKPNNEKNPTVSTFSPVPPSLQAFPVGK